MRSVIVLAVPGAPPLDYPKQELAEFYGLRSRLAQAAGRGTDVLSRRFRELDRRIRSWPRSAENDPIYSGAQDLAVQLRRTSGRKVILGFNKFSPPNLDEALDQAAEQGAEIIIIVTPVMIRGEELAENDIPAAVDRARERHPRERFVYAWPFSDRQVAEFLNSQLKSRS